MTTSAIIVNTNTQDPPLRPERIYVGIDLGYREHVAVAIPLAAFNPQHRPEGWKRMKTLKFTSDAAGYQRLKRYLGALIWCACTAWFRAAVSDTSYGGSGVLTQHAPHQAWRQKDS